MRTVNPRTANSNCLVMSSSCSERAIPPAARESEPHRFFDDERRRAGTLAPFFRASLNPMAIACFRLVTVRPDPLFSVPFFRRRIADPTRFDADFPYLAIDHLAVDWCTDCSNKQKRCRSIAQSSLVISTIVRLKPNRSKSRWARAFGCAVHSTTRGAPRSRNHEAAASMSAVATPPLRLGSSTTTS